MLINFLKNFFKSKNQKTLEKINITLNIINDMAVKFSKFSDKKLKEYTFKYRNEVFNGVSLDMILPKAYSLVIEASKRILGIKHFNVQIIGGIVLHNSCIAEMKTGEGKTLTSTLPIYLNALSCRGVHVVTMNDYLAKRDYNQNKKLFNFLGVSVGLNLPEMDLNKKKKSYLEDITYGTNNEFCFDYLRDNMIFCMDQKVQRNLNYAIIDEVDSILIDEARTPLVMSGSLSADKKLYNQINNLVSNFILEENSFLQNCDSEKTFCIDEKRKQAYFTEVGFIKLEKIFVERNFFKKNYSLYSSKNIIFFQYATNALKAHTLFFKNKDYIVKNKKILIVDEHTGRVSKGRRWSDGLHQAIEAKENIEINNENYTLASITFQNYFRLYKKISGMTGTAATESEEFKSIYNLDTVSIPTNKSIVRKDLPDLIYMTEKEKIKAIIEDIKSCVKRKQPVLVGTISIEKSEFISKKLQQLNIKHKVLNAKFHDKEAEIVKMAGALGSVTIATNMAGRGTDIMLGGDFNSLLKYYKSSKLKFNYKKIFNLWEKNRKFVLNSGGLHIIGTERHESRRIDNQLKGRAGRQGDVGSSRFYISMEDYLLRIFLPDNMINIIKSLGLKKNKSINNIFVSNAIQNSQKKLENYNYEIRARLLEYDDIINEQRTIFYEKRNKILRDNKVDKIIFEISKEIFKSIVNMYFVDSRQYNKKNIKMLKKYVEKFFKIKFSRNFFCFKKKTFHNKRVISFIVKVLENRYKRKKYYLKKNNFNKFEKILVLKILDLFWREHLYDLEHLKNSIFLRGYAEKDPKQEYKKESFLMFMKMIWSIKHEIVSLISLFSYEKCSFEYFIYTLDEFYNNKFFLKTSFFEFIKYKKSKKF
ncbi:preprotein translocase subunit SecA [Buchnera aphidicola (Chaitoregma tattakana)]|uniref:preprotein translocase subunit SecA n=1 Tax=Buchnera aphidicola TaxID=9 RepID=UPI0031B7EF41